VIGLPSRTRPASVSRLLGAAICQQVRLGEEVFPLAADPPVSGVTWWWSLSAVEGLRVFSRAAHGVEV
jgi:hypothetical protein